MSITAGRISSFRWYVSGVQANSYPSAAVVPGTAEARVAGPWGAGPMGKTYFTADLHLGHRLVSGLRGFGDPAEHDAAIADQWRSIVGTNDIVWVLGDLAMASSNRGIDEVLGKIAVLPGTKQLIAGNHDPVHPMHRDTHRWQRRYLEVFESVQAFGWRKIGLSLPDGQDDSQTVLLSHFPYSADHEPGARYLEYRMHQPPGVRHGDGSADSDRGAAVSGAPHHF